ncbi:MAG: hypothetical protein AMJ81_00535 [Phycisphaerae bacterium SM23_33]|nr:MAG: hypothetical protein AMJ81_00535 [Phycisphaerae bacterium SM23_33]
MSTAAQIRLRPLALADVQIGPGFWGRRVAINRRATIPHIHRKLLETRRIQALEMKWRPGKSHRPHQFYDSDIAKWLEAAAYSLTTHPDPKLESRVNAIIRLLGRAQQADGYLNSYYTQVEPKRRWSNLRDMHELYCAGHLIEAGVAHFQATGKRTLLDVVCRYADHIDSVFGPGKRTGCPGHEEIELALVRLYRATGQKRYLKLSKYFIDQRGRRPHFFDAEAKARGEEPGAFWGRTYEYCQAHRPVRRQRVVVGHAVRAMYLYSAMADLAGETGDDSLMAACRRLWNNLTQRRMYITGGIGPSFRNEGFTSDYDLPNDTAYAETCAAIGLVLWAQRMVNLTGEARYADVMERALYNGVLSGVSLDGRKFFYENPLAAYGDQGTIRHGRARRQEFFGCACCPPNVARLIASIGTYAYSAGPGAAYVHLYAAGEAAAEIAEQKVTLSQHTRYPWDGQVSITVTTAAPVRFDLMLRVPGWCRRWGVKLNGKAVRAAVMKGYARIRHRWADGDVVALSLAMPVERVQAHPKVPQDAGRVAIQRGPLLYCLEQVDHAADVHAILLPDRSRLTARFQPRLLGGVTVIQGRGLALARTGWTGRLYRPTARRSTRPIRIKAVPYCLWANRRKGSMTVWLPRA